MIEDWTIRNILAACKETEDACRITMFKDGSLFIEILLPLPNRDPVWIPIRRCETPLETLERKGS